MGTIVYECSDLAELPADAVDGSNDLLRPEDQVTDAERASILAGLPRRVIDARRGAGKPPDAPPAAD